LGAAALGLMLAATPGARRELPLRPGLRRLGAALVGVALAASVVLGARGWLADTHLQRAFEARARGEWSSALEEALAARRLGASPREAAFLEGSAWLALSNRARASRAFEAVLERRPWELNALANLALVQSSAGEKRAALETSRRALELQPESAVLQFRTGVLLGETGSPQQALQHFARAASLEPRSRFYHFQWGVAALQQGAHTQAERALRAAVRLSPGSAVSHKALGVLLVDVLNRQDEGIPHLRRALELEPAGRDAPRLREIVARYDAGRGDPSEARIPGLR
jgi:tetratricopeptide (TPR) repeat protein